MALIYLPKEDYSLNKNPAIAENLKKANITQEQYNEEILPFFNSLPGFYRAQGQQLFGILFPRMKFSLNGISLTKTLQYLLEKEQALEVPIQDKNSFQIEHTKYGYVNPHEQLIHSGLAILNYKKQTGTIYLSRDNGVEKRKTNLDSITVHEKWIPTGTLSGSAIDRIFG